MRIKGNITTDQAIDWLVRNGVIDTPEYWREAVMVVKDLDLLLVKMVRKFSFC